MAGAYQPVACAFHENGVSAQANVSEANVKRSGRSQSLEFAVFCRLGFKLTGDLFVDANGPVFMSRVWTTLCVASLALFVHVVVMYPEKGYAADSYTDKKNIIELVTTLPITMHFNALAWRPDNTHLAILNSLTSKIEIWDARSVGRVLAHTLPTGGSAGDITYSLDGRFLAVGERTIVLFDAHSYKVIREIVGPFVDRTKPQSIGVSSIAFSPDGDRLAVVYNLAIPGGAVIAVYDTQSGTLLKNIEVDGGVAGKLIFTPDGKMLIGGRQDLTKVRLALKRANNPDSDPTEINRLPDFEINYWDAESGRQLRSIENVHLMSISALSISANGKWLATGSRTGERRAFWNRKTNSSFPAFVDQDPIRIWDVGSGRLVAELATGQPAKGIAFSADSRHIVSCHPGDIVVWDLLSGKVVQKESYRLEQGVDGFCQPSQDGRLLAVQRAADVAIYGFNEKTN